jgi:ADP-heptose:LPS heptosyltransferase
MKKDQPRAEWRAPRPEGSAAQSSERFYAGSPRNVLVVRPGALGDTILTLPLLASVAGLHPGAKITFLGTRSYENLIPPEIRFQAADGADWTWLFAENLSPPWRKEPQFDLAYLVLKRPEVVVANLTRAGTHRVRSVHSAPPPGRHVVEHLHRGLGLPLPPKAAWVRHLAAARPQDVIWMHPGSGGSTKCAPLKLFVTLADEMRRATGWDLIITAGEDDAFLKSQEQWQALTAIPGATVIDNQSLKRLGELLAGARVFVGNDSGMSHMAAGLGIPSAVLFVSTEPAQWSPWVPPAQLSIVDLRGTHLERVELQALLAELLRLASAA